MPRRLIELCLKEPKQLEGNTIYVVFHRIANGSGARAISNKKFTYHALTEKGKKEKLRGKNAQMSERTQEYTEFIRDIEQTNKTDVSYKRLIREGTKAYDRCQSALNILESINLD